MCKISDVQKSDVQNQYQIPYVQVTVVSFSAPNNPSADVIHAGVHWVWLQDINNLAHFLGQS